jgi:hypothetical protein
MIEKIADFLHDRISLLNTWDKEVFTEMAYWYASNGLLFAVKDDEDDIIGATIVRVIHREEDSEKDQSDYFYHNPQGDTYYIDFMASDDKEAKKKMMDMVVDRLGLKEFVSYARFKNNNRRVVFPAKRFKQAHQG